MMVLCVFEYAADVGYGEQSDRVLGNEESGVECARCAWAWTMLEGSREGARRQCVQP